MNATLAEALGLLRNRWATLKDEILRGKYVFWIGSGISRGRLDGLNDLLYELVEKLHSCIDPSNTDCPYRKALEDIVRMTTVNVNVILKPRSSWEDDDIKSLINQLSDKYADVLDVDIITKGTAIDLAWDFLKLHEKYSVSFEPDSEHRFLALLIAEGVVKELVTTNWDALIEIAHDACNQSKEPKLQVVACKEELYNNIFPKLFKIHGCALKMVSNPKQYRPFMVATRTHINQWISDDVHKTYREKMGVLLREYPALFIGLSGQDYNLQATFVAAALGELRQPQRVVFTVSRITHTQRAILKAAHGIEYYRKNAPRIDNEAALPLYAKPLLGSLYILTLLEKAGLLLQQGAKELNHNHQDLVRKGIMWIEDFLCKRYDDNANPEEPWRRLADEVPGFIARFISLYREQEVSKSIQAYQALCSQNLTQMEIDKDKKNFHWLLFALALFLEGMERGFWKLEVPPTRDGRQGQLILNHGKLRTKLFILNDTSNGRTNLLRQDFIKPKNAADVMIVYPHGSKLLERQERGNPKNRDLPRSRSKNEPSEFLLQVSVLETPQIDKLLDRIKDKLRRK
jgi:hypothetical protein